VSQPLWARAMAIGSDSSGPAVLIAVDNCGVSAAIRRAVAAEAERLHGISPDRLTITSTHTHSAPMLTGVLNHLLIRDMTDDESSSVDRYTQYLTQKLVNVIGDALANRTEVRLGLARGRVDFAINRRGAGIVDHEVPLIVATDIAGVRRAVITNYACHCVAAGSGLNLCGDWAGYAASAIESDHPGATAIVLIGCGADQNPSQMNSTQAARDQGQMLADEVRRLLDTPQTELAGNVTTRFAEIALPLADLPSQSEWETRAGDAGITGYHARKNLQRLSRDESLPTEIFYPVQTWAFGDDLAMVFLGGEVVVDYSHRLRKSFDADRLWVTAYANDVACYIPSERVLKEGGYEGGDAMVWYDQPAALASGVEELIVQEVRAQLAGAFDADPAAARTGGTRPLLPAESLKTMQTHDRLRIELVAAEPLVADPVAIDFGHDGKLWVAEMHDYPEGLDGNYKPGGRVKFLEDTDGDGNYDRATTFLDGIAFPTGVTVWRSGVLICSAPDVLYAEDTTGDGKADFVRKVLSGFYTDNIQARVNGLSLGLDNWLHGAAGIFGGTLTNAAGITVDSTNRDFRFRPDDGDLQSVSGRSQQGRVRDDWGNWFGCDNSTLLLHFPTTDHYHLRNPHIAAANPSLVIAASNKLYPRGPLIQWALSGPPGVPTAACGLGIYRDKVLGEEFYNNSFTCEPVNQLVHRMRLDADGVTFKGQRPGEELDREFLSSTDSWFRPVQAKTGPDGALYVVDMHRYMIEHPNFLTQEARAEIDVRAGDQLGRIYRVVPKSFTTPAIPVLATADTQDVVSHLRSANGTLRDMAHQQLLWRRDPAATRAIREIVIGSKAAPVAASRLQALCLLDGLGVLDVGVIAVAMSDLHGSVRRHAARLAESWVDSDEELGKRLAKLAEDDDPQVRMQVAYSLGQWNHPEAGPVLARMADRAMDDPWMKSAILSSLNAKNIGPALATVFAFQTDLANPHPLVEELLGLAVRMGDADTLADAIDRVVTPHDGDYQAWQWDLMPRLMQALNQRKEVLDGDRLIAWQAMLAEAARRAGDPSLAEDRRVSAIRSFPYAGRHIDAVEILADLLGPQSPATVQRAAIETLAAIDTGDAAEAIFVPFAQLTPAVQGFALDAAMERRAVASELIARIEAAEISRGSIDPGRRQTLVNHPDADVSSRAQRLFKSNSSDEVAALIRSYQSIDPGVGDIDHGKEVFTKHCAACHRIDSIGHPVGPDLTALTDKSKRAYLASILDPNEAIDRRYATYSALTNQGQLLTGIITSESGNSITLVGQEGKEHVILRNDLEVFRSTGVSLMPTGLERMIPPPDMADLLAFLGAGGAGGKYRFPGPGGPDDPYGDDPTKPKLTDGHLGSETFDDGNWIGLRHIGGVRKHQIEFDLGEPTLLRSIRITFGVNHQPGGIHAPKEIRLALSDDGDRFTDRWVASGFDDTPDGLGAYQIARRTTDIAFEELKARYVRIGVINDGEWTFLSEIEINPRTSQASSPNHRSIETLAMNTAESESVGQEDHQTDAASPFESVNRMVRLLDGVDLGTEDEYRVIPGLFHAAIDAGRRNEPEEILAILDFSLPKDQESLRDWQAVVIGGGVINGISQSGRYPLARIVEIIGTDAAILDRWDRSLDQALSMADDVRVKQGTRYDALRMIAVLPWEKAREPLTRYLTPGTPGELMQGAVSGLADVPHPEAAVLLAKAIDHLENSLHELAVEGLVRVQDDTNQLIVAIETGRIAPGEIVDGLRQKLLDHENAMVSDKARALLKR
jgi:putative membrane-bound dehydrogenase-like protein